MKIAVCDDEAAQAALFSRMARDWAVQTGRPVEIDAFPSAEAFLFAWEADKSYALLLLDIQMGGLDGMALARRLRQEGAGLSIVFLTGFPDYIAQGYEVEALHYLLKPVDREKLFQCLDRAARRAGGEPTLLVTDSQGAAVRILQRELLYAEAFAHTVELHTAGGCVTVRMGLGALMQQLTPGWFVRCHRSYLAALRAVARIDRSELRLDDGTLLPVSRRLLPEVSRAFAQFYREGEREC